MSEVQGSANAVENSLVGEVMTQDGQTVIIDNVFLHGKGNTHRAFMTVIDLRDRSTEVIVSMTVEQARRVAGHLMEVVSLSDRSMGEPSSDVQKIEDADIELDAAGDADDQYGKDTAELVKEIREDSGGESRRGRTKVAASGGIINWGSISSASPFGYEKDGQTSRGPLGFPPKPQADGDPAVSKELSEFC